MRRIITLFCMLTLAFGLMPAIALAAMVDDGTGHENEVLENLSVYMMDGDELGSTPIRDAAGTLANEQQIQDVNVSSAAGTVQFAAVPTWTAKQGGEEGGSEGGDQGGEGGQDGLTWQRSLDKGKTWEVYNDENVQSIDVMTDDEHIGNLFRVILEANSIDEETGENRKTTSDPVEIVVGKMSFIVINYIPPLAGTTAVFNTQFQIIETDPIDTSNPKYYWEWTDDDGKTYAPKTKTVTVKVNVI